MTAIPSAAAFHRHLDACRQCREKPFAPCVVGNSLLTIAANEDQKNRNEVKGLGNAPR